MTYSQLKNCDSSSVPKNETEGTYLQTGTGEVNMYPLVYIYMNKVCEMNLQDNLLVF